MCEQPTRTIFKEKYTIMVTIDHALANLHSAEYYVMWIKLFIKQLMFCSQDFSWFQEFYKSPFASEFSWKKRSSLYCVQTCVCGGCGESVNPPKGGFVLYTKGRPRHTAPFSREFLLLSNHTPAFRCVLQEKEVKIHPENLIGKKNSSSHEILIYCYQHLGVYNLGITLILNIL